MVIVTSGKLFKPMYTFDASDLVVNVRNDVYLDQLGRPVQTKLVDARYMIKFANVQEYRQFVAETQSGNHPRIIITLED